MGKLYIQIRDREFGYIISYIELLGEKKDLSFKLRGFDYAKSIGMPNEYMFQEFRLLHPIELEHHKEGDVDYVFGKQ